MTKKQRSSFAVLYAPVMNARSVSVTPISTVSVVDTNKSLFPHL